MRHDPFAKLLANGSNLRTADGWTRRKAVKAAVDVAVGAADIRDGLARVRTGPWAYVPSAFRLAALLALALRSRVLSPEDAWRAGASSRPRPSSSQPTTQSDARTPHRPPNRAAPAWRRCEAQGQGVSLRGRRPCFILFATQTAGRDLSARHISGHATFGLSTFLRYFEKRTVAPIAHLASIVFCPRRI